MSGELSACPGVYSCWANPAWRLCLILVICQLKLFYKWILFEWSMEPFLFSFLALSLLNPSLIWKWGTLAKVLLVNNSPVMVFVVLFIALSAICRAGLPGSIAMLICFQPPSSAPFLKSKIDMFSAAVPPPLCFSSVWDWSRSIAKSCLTSCCDALQLRSLNRYQGLLAETCSRFRKRGERQLSHSKTRAPFSVRISF